MKTCEKAAIVLWASSVVLAGLAKPGGGSSPSRRLFLLLWGGYFIVRGLSLLFALILVARTPPPEPVLFSRVVEEAGMDRAAELTAAAVWAALMLFIVARPDYALSGSMTVGVFFLVLFVAPSVFIPLIAWAFRRVFPVRR